jgi:hypothetical protein
LDALNSQRITIGNNSIAASLTGSYYETTDERKFRAVDSQRMFQFTIDAEHPIRGKTETFHLLSRQISYTNRSD